MVCDIWFHQTDRQTELGSYNEFLFGHHKPKNESKSRAIVVY